MLQRQFVWLVTRPSGTRSFNAERVRLLMTRYGRSGKPRRDHARTGQRLTADFSGRYECAA